LLVNSDQARSPRHCAFCGGGSARPAHALPDWLRECFRERDSPSAELRAKVRLACKRCSNGWMSRLEAEAMPVLKLLIAGRPFVLGLRNQETLALWAVQTILMLEAAHDPTTFSSEAHRHVFEHREPPTGFQLALGIRPREGEWPCRFTAQGFTASNGRLGLLPTYPGMTIDSYRAGLCIGHLVVRARASFAPADAQLLADPIDAASLPIWPATSPARWPPAAGLVRMQTFDSAFESLPAVARRAA
jgi:hypothetical protein